MLNRATPSRISSVYRRVSCAVTPRGLQSLQEYFSEDDRSMPSIRPKHKPIKVNDALTLTGITPQVFDYRLGNRSTLDWVIDQYQVHHSCLRR
jgi:predicted helicase